MTAPSTLSPPFVVDPVFARRFATEWIESWNTHDLPRILSHYTDDFEMRSPLIIERMKIPSGILRGKEAVATYWRIGIAAQPPLRFELIETFIGASVVSIVYLSVTRQRRVVEWFEFEPSGKVCRSASAYSV